MGLAWLLAGCAYYNYLYNAKKYYRQGEAQRTSSDKASSGTSGGSAYDKCIESAGRMLQYYPNSRWEDEALLLLAKAYYRTGKHRNCITKADELAAKYPQSRLVAESQVWKGMALLMIDQADSGLALLESPLTGVPSEVLDEADFAVADYYFSAERWEEARERYSRLLDRDTPSRRLKYEAWLKMGECLRAMNRPAEAAEHYRRIMDSHPTRRIAFRAELEMARTLRDMGEPERALDILERLLEDGAWTADFSQLNLESALALKKMGKSEEALKRLTALLETEKRGEVAAQANWELGELYWTRWRAFVPASAALKEAANLAKGTALGIRADSLRNEAEGLFGAWKRLEFLHHQAVMIDSARLGLREVWPKDTAYVDSLGLVSGEDRKARGSPRRSERRQARSRSAISTPAADTLAVTAPDSIPLNDSALAALSERRRWELSEALETLANVHLFTRNDLDSASFYYGEAAASAPPGPLWARATAALAYISALRNNLGVRDSLYRLIVEQAPETPVGREVARKLGLTEPEAAPNPADSLLAEAERLWRQEGDFGGAQSLYLRAAEEADSGSATRARALLAAAYLLRVTSGSDSSARPLYALVAAENPNSEYGAFARRRAQPFGAGEGRESGLARGDLSKLETEMSERSPSSGEVVFPQDSVLSEVFPADKVDQVPELLTSPMLLDNLIRSAYPFQAMMEQVRGRALVEVTVGTDGRPTDPVVVEEDPAGYGFGDAALEVISKLDYRPGKFRGRVVAVRIRQSIAFRVEQP